MKQPQQSVRPIAPGQLTGAARNGGPGVAFDALRDVEMRVTVEIGGTTMPMREVLTLGIGRIVELDRLVGEPVDVLVNHHKFARGEVVAIAETFGVRITELLIPEGPVADIGEGPADTAPGAALGEGDSASAGQPQAEGNA
ncbi:MAG: flagellar motor switch protein FliN [bacterium]